MKLRDRFNRLFGRQVSFAFVAALMAMSLSAAETNINGVKVTYDGATLSDAGGEKVLTFTHDGSFAISEGGTAKLRILAIGGGGGGGSQTVKNIGAGGGGAGGVVESTDVIFNAGTYYVGVGKGGAKHTGLITGTAGMNGGFSLVTNAANRVFISAMGGAGGGASGNGSTVNGQNGASGGGATWNATTHEAGVGGRGNINQGNAGGTPTSAGVGAGGGGAGGAGGADGTAGAGLVSDITGANVTYAKGGKGGVRYPTDAAADAVDGFGNGGDGGSTDGTEAVPGFGGKGGDGVVIVRFSSIYQVQKVPYPIYTTNFVIAASATHSSATAFDKAAYDTAHPGAIAELKGTNTVSDIYVSGSVTNGYGRYKFTLTLNEGYAWDNGTPYGDMNAFVGQWRVVTDASIVDATIGVSKEVEWGEGGSNATVRITSYSTPGLNPIKPKVLFLGGVCGAHSQKTETLQDALDALSKTASNIDCYLVASTNDHPNLAKSESKGVHYEHIVNGKTESGGSAIDVKSILQAEAKKTNGGDWCKSGGALKDDNHCVAMQFFEILNNRLTKSDASEYDYIVMEFDGNRIMWNLAVNDDSRKILRGYFNTLTDKLLPYYKSGKVLWIVDDSKSASASSDPFGNAYYTPSSFVMTGGGLYTACKPNDGTYSWRFGALALLLDPGAIGNRNGYSKTGKIYKSSSTESDAITVGYIDSKNVSVSSTTATIYSLGRNELQTYYNDAKKVVSYIETNITPVGYNLQYNDTIQTSVGLTIEAADAKILTNGAEGYKKETLPADNDAKWTPLFTWDKSMGTEGQMTEAGRQLGITAYLTCDKDDNHVSLMLTNMDFAAWTRLNIKIADDGNFKTSVDATWNPATQQWEKNPNKGMARVDLVDGEGNTTDVYGEADTSVEWKFTTYNVSGAVTNGTVYLNGLTNGQTFAKGWLTNTIGFDENYSPNVSYRGNPGFKVSEVYVNGELTDAPTKVEFATLDEDKDVVIYFESYVGTYESSPATNVYDGAAHVFPVEFKDFKPPEGYDYEVRYSTNPNAADDEYLTADAFAAQQTAAGDKNVGTYTYYYKLFVYQPGYGEARNIDEFGWVAYPSDGLHNTVTIVPRPVVITAKSVDVDDLATTADAALAKAKAAGVTCTGFIDNDSVETNRLQWIWIDEYKQEKGQYRVLATNDTGVADVDLVGENYEPHFVPGVVSVLRSAIRIDDVPQYPGLDPEDPYTDTGVPRVEKIYDGVATNLIVNVTEPGDPADYVITYTTTPDDPASWGENPTFVHAGTNKVWYAVTPVNGAEDDYFPATNYQYVIILPRPVTLQAASATKPCDGTPLVTNDCVLVEGTLAPGDAIADAGCQGAQTTVGSSDNVIGEGITFTVGLVTDYDITRLPGLLTVTAAPMTFEGETEGRVKQPSDPDWPLDPSEDGVDDLVTCYDGEGKHLLINVVDPEDDSALDFAYSLDGVNWMSEGPLTNVCDHVKMYYSVTDPEGNYVAVTNFGYVTITQRVVTVYADDKTIALGDPEPEYTYSVSNAAPRDVATIKDLVTCTSVTCPDYATKKDVPGDYDIKPAGASSQGNYTVLYVNGILTIKEPKIIEVDHKPQDPRIGLPTPPVADDDGESDTGVRNVVKYYDGVPTNIVIDVTEPTEGYDIYYTTNDWATVLTNAAPQYVDVGTNVIWYAIEANGYSSVTNYGYVVILPAPFPPFRADGYNGNYDAEEHQPTVDASALPEGSTVRYSKDGPDGPWSDDPLGYTDVTNGTVWVQATNPNYAPVVKAVPIIISRRKIILAGPDKEKPFDGTALTFDASEIKVSGSLFAGGETFAFSAFASRTDLGSCASTFRYADGTAKISNYDVTTDFEHFLTIKPNDGQLVVESLSGTWTYDGEAHGKGLVTNNVELLGLEDVLSVDFPGVTVKDVGVVTNVFSAAILRAGEDVTGTYTNFFCVTGVLEVVRAKITDADIAAPAVEKTYDGEPTNATVTVTGELVKENDPEVVYFNPETETWDATPPQYTDATNVVVRYIVTADNFEPYTNETTVTVLPRAITVTSQPQSKIHDGTPLETDVTALDVGGDGFVDGETVSYLPAASITEVGSTNADFTVVFDGTAKECNYTVKKSLGTLTVTPEGVLTVFAPSEVFDYDGTAHSCTTWTDTPPATGLKDGDELAVVIDPACTVTKPSEGSVPNVIQSVTVTRGGTDVTDEYTVEKVPGALSVRKGRLDAAVSAENVEKIYDAAGTNITVVVDDSQLVAGTVTTIGYALTEEGPFMDENPVYTNAADVAYVVWYVVSAPEYESFTNCASVKINLRPLTLESAGAEKVYDGTALETNEVSVVVEGDSLPLAPGDFLDATCSGSQTAVGTAANEFTFSITNALGAADLAKNYDITRTEGKLTVKKAPQKTKDPEDPPEGALTPYDYIGVYDGQGHTVVPFTVTEPEMSAVTFSFSTNGTEWTSLGKGEGNACPYLFTNVCEQVKVWFRSEAENYETLVTNGYVTITNRHVTITTGSTNFIYNATAQAYTNLTAETATAEEIAGGKKTGFVPGEGLATTTDWSTVTFVGDSSDNECSYTLQLNADSVAANYAIDWSHGTLAVEPKKVDPESGVIAVGTNMVYGTTAPAEETLAWIDPTDLCEGDYVASVSLVYTNDFGTLSTLAVGTYPDMISTNDGVAVAIVISNATDDVTGNYVMGFKPGLLTVLESPIKPDDPEDEPPVDPDPKNPDPREPPEEGDGPTLFAPCVVKVYDGEGTNTQGKVYNVADDYPFSYEYTLDPENGPWAEDFALTNVLRDADGEVTSYKVYCRALDEAGNYVGTNTFAWVTVMPLALTNDTACLVADDTNMVYATEAPSLANHTWTGPEGLVAGDGVKSVDFVYTNDVAVLSELAIGEYPGMISTNGSAAIVITNATGDVTGNYEIGFKPGMLTVTANLIRPDDPEDEPPADPDPENPDPREPPEEGDGPTLFAPCVVKVYDGEGTNTQGKVYNVADDYPFAYEYTLDPENGPWTEDFAVTNVLRDADGEVTSYKVYCRVTDETGNFVGTNTFAWVTVLPLALTNDTACLVADDTNMVYATEAPSLANHTWTGPEGLVAGDGVKSVDFVYTNDVAVLSTLAVGDYAGMISTNGSAAIVITNATGDVTGNYEIGFRPGVLTIVNADIEKTGPKSPEDTDPPTPEDPTKAWAGAQNIVKCFDNTGTNVVAEYGNLMPAGVEPEVRYSTNETDWVKWEELQLTNVCDAVEVFFTVTVDNYNILTNSAYVTITNAVINPFGPKDPDDPTEPGPDEDDPDAAWAGAQNIIKCFDGIGTNIVAVYGNILPEDAEVEILYSLAEEGPYAERVADQFVEITDGPVPVYFTVSAPNYTTLTNMAYVTITNALIKPIGPNDPDDPLVPPETGAWAGALNIVKCYDGVGTNIVVEFGGFIPADAEVTVLYALEEQGAYGERVADQFVDVTNEVPVYFTVSAPNYGTITNHAFVTITNATIAKVGPSEPGDPTMPEPPEAGAWAGATNVVKVYDGNPTNITVVTGGFLPEDPEAVIQYSLDPEGPFGDENPSFTSVTNVEVFFTVEVPNYGVLTNSAWLTIVPGFPRIPEEGPGEVGPFSEPPTGPAPLPDVTAGTIVSSNDYVGVYDGEAHTIDTNRLWASLAEDPLLWANGPKVTYSLTGADGTWQDDPFTWTDAVTTSFWYCVEAPNFSNYYHAAGVTITQRVVTIVFPKATKVFDGTPDCDPLVTNVVGEVANMVGEERFDATANGGFLDDCSVGDDRDFVITSVDLVASNGAKYQNYRIFFGANGEIEFLPTDVPEDGPASFGPKDRDPNFPADDDPALRLPGEILECAPHFAAEIAWGFNANTGIYFAQLKVTCLNTTDTFDFTKGSMRFDFQDRVEDGTLKLGLWDAKKNQALSKLGQTETLNGTVYSKFPLADPDASDDNGGWAPGVSHTYGPANLAAKTYTSAERLSTPAMRVYTRVNPQYGNEAIVLSGDDASVFIGWLVWQWTDAFGAPQTATIPVTANKDYASLMAEEDPLAAPLTTDEMNLRLAAGVTFDDPSDLSARLTAFAPAPRRLSGALKTVNEKTGEEGVPGANARLTLKGAATLDGVFETVGEGAANGDGTFEFAKPEALRFFRVDVEVVPVVK